MWIWLGLGLVNTLVIKLESDWELTNINTQVMKILLYNSLDLTLFTRVVVLQRCDLCLFTFCWRVPLQLDSCFGLGTQPSTTALNPTNSSVDLGSNPKLNLRFCISPLALTASVSFFGRRKAVDSEIKWHYLRL